MPWESNQPPEIPLWVEVESFPQSTNQIWRKGRHGQMYKTMTAKSWEAEAMTKTRNAALKVYGTADLSRFRGLPVDLEIRLYSPSWKGKNGLYKRPDLSNFIKSAEDALFRALGLDDCAVIRLFCSKCIGEKTLTVMCLKFSEGSING